jgi:phage shock protein E
MTRGQGNMKLLKILIPCMLMVNISSHLFAGSSSDALVKDKIKKGAQIIDVRTPEEFAQGHYPGAKNIPVGELMIRLNELGATDKPIVLYCRSGRRSAMAKQILIDQGFTDVTDAGALEKMPK